MELITQWKIRSIADLEAVITVPEKGFFVRNKTSMRLCYNIQNKIQYIYLPTPADAAKFLKKHGLIESYVFVDDNVKMYTQTLITTVGSNNEPVQLSKTLPVAWDDIKLNEVQVITCAAIHEYEKAGGLMCKVIDMATNYLKRA